MLFELQERHSNAATQMRKVYRQRQSPVIEPDHRHEIPSCTDTDRLGDSLRLTYVRLHLCWVGGHVTLTTPHGVWGHTRQPGQCPGDTVTWISAQQLLVFGIKPGPDRAVARP